MPATVLVVHSQAVLADAFQADLVRAGFQPEWSPSVAAACRKILEKQPDLILLEAELTLQDQFRPDACWSEIYPPLILLIPPGAQEISRYLQSPEVVDFLCLPCSTEELQARLRLALAGRSRQPEAAPLAVEGAEPKQHRLQRSALLGMAAHDLRVLVSVIDGYCLLLNESDSGSLSKEQHELIAGLMTGSRRLVDMANNLLDYSRIEAGHFELKRERWNICEIIGSVFGELLPLLQRREIRLLTDCLSWEVPVFCDEQGIRRVLYNILNNALKFTPDRGQIKLELASGETEIRVSIEDSGRGIEPDLLANLFAEYRCTPSPDGFPGNGLGLAICKKIIEAHQGRIWAESCLGQGSRFTFCLPK